MTKYVFIFSNFHSKPGRHCCLWCEITKQELQIAPDKITKTPPPRSLATLARDFKAFKADGSRPDRMKLFNNVIEEPLFHIPLEQVSSQYF